MGLMDKLKGIFRDDYAKARCSGTPASLDPSKSYCGPCGIYYDSSNSSCPFCHGDPEIEEIRRSYD